MGNVAGDFLVHTRAAELLQDQQEVAQGNNQRGRAGYQAVDAPFNGFFRSLLDCVR